MRINRNINVALRRLSVVVPLLAICFCVLEADAQVFDTRKNLGEISFGEGIGRRAIDILERRPGAGKREAMDTIVSKFTDSNDAVTTRGEIEETRQSRNKLFVRGKGWNLIVEDDGTHVTYANENYHINAKEAYGECLVNDESQLESIARNFILTNLDGIIELGENERIVPFGLQVEQLRVRDDDGIISDKNLGYAVTFTRVIDDIIVVGKGSKITVYLSTDGSPYAFEYDWPEYYAIGESQEVLGITKVWERVDRYTENILGLASVSFEKFECGYYDGGSDDMSDPQIIQSACYLFINGSDEYRYTLAIAHPIPVGSNVYNDERWSQSTPEVLMFYE